jgi:hypothetical protein
LSCMCVKGMFRAAASRCRSQGTLLDPRQSQPSVEVLFGSPGRFAAALTGVLAAAAPLPLLDLTQSAASSSGSSPYITHLNSVHTGAGQRH